jgi:hypothetical protein
LAERLFVLGTVGSQLVNCFLLQLTLGDARLLEERAATQLFQHASALEFLLEALQRTVNGFVVFDLNDNHIGEFECFRYGKPSKSGRKDNQGFCGFKTDFTDFVDDSPSIR